MKMGNGATYMIKKALKFILIFLLKFLFCFFFTIMVGCLVALIGTLGIADTKNLDWQIVLYVGLGIFLILGAWINSFFKTPDKIKLLFVILFPIWFFSTFLLPSVMYAIDEDTCLDTGLCSEGLKFGNDVMSKEYCLKEGKKWDDKRKECDMEIESRTCREQGYEWLIEKGKCSHKIVKDW